jgi:hypothetical protein
MEYNTARNQLVIRSYGRNIQKMIEDVVKIEDAHKRNEAAKAIIRIMAQVNPENTTQNATQNAQRESEDYWHKLWNHLVIISDYKLNIDAPFPKPVPHTEKPQQVLHNYDKRTIRYRTYGRNMENIIRTVSQYPEAQRQRLVLTLANHLKKLFLYYNRDSVDDAFIAMQINEMSGGKLKLPEGYALESTKDILKNYSPINAASLSKNNGSKKPKKKKKIRKPQR